MNGKAMDTPQTLTWRSAPVHSLRRPSMRLALVVAASVTGASATDVTCGYIIFDLENPR
jgi:hypothetical protein